MHEIQKIFLKRLLINNNQKYSSLTGGYSFEDNIVFHLKQLLKKGFIEKTSNIYKISSVGIKEIAKYDLSSLTDTGFKTFFIGFVCKSGDDFLVKEHPGGKTNFYNLPSGKPHFGEKTEKALIRIFYENTGLEVESNNFKYLSLHLKTIKTSTGEVLFDDAFAIYQVIVNPSHRSKMELGRQIQWMNLEKIRDLTNKWPELDILLVQNNRANYLQYEFVSDYILD